MYPIKGVNKVISNNKDPQQEIEELIYILEAETNTAIDSIMVADIETLLDIASITL